MVIRYPVEPHTGHYSKVEVQSDKPYLIAEGSSIIATEDKERLSYVARLSPRSEARRG